MSARLAVLGGGGFLGSHLCPHLTGMGYTLVVPSRDAERASASVSAGEERVKADINNPDELKRCLDGVDVVINLVGILNEKGRDGSGFRAAHTDLTASVVAACEELGIRRLIQISSLNADENGPSHYQRSKGAAEKLIRASTLDWSILQPSVIFGPRDSFVNRFAGLLLFARPLFPLAGARARFQPVSVDNVVTAVERCLTDEKTIGQTYELGGPDIFTLAELVTLIGEAAGRRTKVISIPGWMESAQAQVLDRVPGKPFSIDNYNSLSVDSVVKEDGLKQLNIEPVSLHNDIQRTLGIA